MRKLDFDKDKVFECGGRKFFVRDSLSFARYRELQKLSVEFAYSATFHDIFKHLNLAIDSFNKHRYDEMIIVIHNIMNGITKLESKDDPALRMCALFIDEEGEDPVRFDEAKMKDKIDCWAKELEVTPFFYLAASLTAGWMPAYEVVLRGGLKEEESESSEPSTTK